MSSPPAFAGEMNNCQEIDGIREFLKKFREECIELRITYQTFHILFERDDGTVQLLHEAAAQFFDFIGRALQEYYILQVCRLTDPARQGGFTNFTHKRLNQLLCENNLLTSEIKNFSKGLDRYRELVLPARNKLIGHRDEKTVRNLISLGAHEQKDIDELFKNLNKYCDSVAESLRISYKNRGVEDAKLQDLQPLDMSWIPGPGDEQDLIKKLEEHRGWTQQYNAGEIPSYTGRTQKKNTDE